MTRHQNALIHESSPYLLQHAHNPVNWFPWGDEALSLARREDKPILLSIGYAACHWCHVMERESFENEATAAQMNRDFVCIKVDREERPDLDDIYMAATVAMSGHGGWPMTVFLTPDQKPFFAGTYFPPSDAHGRPGFPAVLSALADAWRGQRSEVEQQAGKLSDVVTQQLGHTCPTPVSAQAIDDAADALSASYDARWGGFGGAPKFPPSASLRLLMHHYARTGSERSLEILRGTLDGMHNGGMFDHVGGGFARYSTDERWHVPHFEKMLYDNAQLARVYTEAHQLTAEPRYREVATRTLDYLMREMTCETGALFSATDADSEGVEGKFFVFNKAEVLELLGEQDGPLFCAYYDISEAGNWEGHNVLWTPRPAADVAAEHGIDEADLARRVQAGQAKLYTARARRIPPALDDKILVSWNGLAIGALAEASRVFGEARYLEAASRAAEDLWTRLRTENGNLLRTARGDKVHLAAYLEDYAFLGDALVDLFEAGAQGPWLERSRQLAERVLTRFSHESGAFYQTADDHEALLTRSVDGQDGAIPNANAIAAQWLARLSYHLDEPPLRKRARAAVEAFGELVQRAPRAFASALTALDFLDQGPVEIALVGPSGPTGPTAHNESAQVEYEALRRALRAHYLPNRIVAEHTNSGDHPLLQGKTAIDGAPTLYICRDFQCQRPITDAAEVAAALARPPASV